jgi:predicted dehydrogenase
VLQGNLYSDIKKKKSFGFSKSSFRITVITIGAGNRGTVYATYAGEHPDAVRLVGVVDPKPVRREMFFNSKFGTQISKNLALSDWRELAAKPRVADAITITTPDRTHAEIALCFAELKYHILLEKPMATTEKDCRDIVSAVERNHCILAVCHVLRYTPYSKLMKKLLDSK